MRAEPQLVSIECIFISKVGITSRSIYYIQYLLDWYIYFKLIILVIIVVVVVVTKLTNFSSIT